MKRGYICETCRKGHELHEFVFNCLNCKKEICESCFKDNMHCQECALIVTEPERERRFNEHTGYQPAPQEAGSDS